MKLLAVLAASSSLCALASVRSYAYDDPTVPSTPASSSTPAPQLKTPPLTPAPSSQQPSKGKTQPAMPEPDSAHPSTAITKAGNNPPIKNGMPCIEEICLHDELQDLSHINWKKVLVRPEDYVRLDPNTEAGARRFVEAMTRSSVSEIDGTGIQSIRKIQGACKALPTLKASYINKNGENVSVLFDSIVSPDGKRQKYIVYRINRYIKGSKSLNNRQIEELEFQGMQRYPAHYKGFKQAGKKFPTGFVMFVPGRDMDTSLALYSPFQTNKFHKTNDGFTLSSFTNPQLFYNFPGCGADRKINL